jgi:hypothetical protein
MLLRRVAFPDFCESCLPSPAAKPPVSKRLGSPYVSGRSRNWVKSKNPAAPAVKREAEEDWGKEKWR